MVLRCTNSSSAHLKPPVVFKVCAYFEGYEKYAGVCTVMLQIDLSQWSILSESKVDNGHLYANIHFLRKRVGGWGVMNGDTVK